MSRLRLDQVRKRVPTRAKHLHADITHLLRWRRLPVARPTRRFVRRHGLRVQGGPFAGMTYPSSAVGRAEQLVAKLLGSYEAELHEPMASVTAEPWEQIVDIGAGDGYYAVGLARLCPGATVRAWEMNPLPARVCLEVARANGVEDRIVMAGECDLEQLRALPELRTLVVSDCEGCEDRLLDPDAVPLLRRGTIVVELHDSLAPGVEERLIERFRSTHEVQTIAMTPRHAGDHPALAAVDGLGYIDQELLVSEFRINAVRWAVMRPLQKT
jgi:predicted O-methyltransferase YrrM